MDGSLWSSVVDEVQRFVPSGNSSSSEDEAIEIFQRPPGLSLRLPDESDGDIFSTDNHTDTKESVKDIEPESSAVNLNKQKSDISLKSNEIRTKNSHNNNLVLSFGRLEELDFNAFHNTQGEEELIKPQQAMTEKNTLTYGDDGKDDCHESIMANLEVFCEIQSFNYKSPYVAGKNYTGGELEENTAGEYNIQERPTVYIDLRSHDHTTKPQITSQHIESVHNQVHMGTETNSWKETGKSMLLRKIRESNEINGCDDKKDSAVNGKRGELHEKSLQFRLSADSCGVCSLPESSQHSSVQSEHAKPQTEGQKMYQHNTEKQREQLYHHIVKELEKWMPTRSVRQKQSAAEKTDLLYDPEASHREPISALPVDSENKGRVLLIVGLSSPGVVAERGRGKRRTIESALTKSHIYNTLVAWFLSLVGPNSPNNIEANAEVPFWVAGLQQLWTEHGLALHVLAVAKHTYKQRKKDSEVHTPFYKHVCRFLSETSLSAIADWLPQLSNLTDKDDYSSLICFPSYHLNHFITAADDKKVTSRIFSLTPGFYWQTLETPEHVCKGRETTQELHTEVSVALGGKSFFQLPLVTHYTLQSLFDSGLDVCGLRLLYPSPVLLGDCVGCRSVVQGHETEPVLAMAVRGPYAHLLLKGINKSVDDIFTKKAIVVEADVAPPLLYTPEEHGHVHREICLWFSGRLAKENGKDEKLKSEVQVISEDASFLCATTKADVLLVVSPLVPASCHGLVLATCERRGFILKGLQRLQLQTHDASLGLNSQQAQVFSGLSFKNSHCLVLILRKENAQHHSTTLPAALMRELRTQNLLACLHSSSDVQTIVPSLCFHTVPYSNTLYHFARSAWKEPDSSTVVLSNQKCPLDLETEQVVVLTLCGKDMSQGLGVLHRAVTQHGFEMLGLKWLPVLSRLQAQEVSPYEVGDKFSHKTVASLMSCPALVCALRCADAFALLKNLLPNDSQDNNGVLMSPTPQVASRQICLFFFEHEIISNPLIVLTVCVFKPGVWNKDFGKILRTLQRTGLLLVGLRVILLNKSDAATLSTSGNELDSGDHVENSTSGSSLAVCLQGEHAVTRLLEMLSNSELFSSIFGPNKSQLYNGIYAPETYEKAIQDVKRLFPEGLSCIEDSTMRQEQIPSMYAYHLASVECDPDFTSAAVKRDQPSCMALDSKRESLIPSAPWQTTCVLLPLYVPLFGHGPSQLDVLEELLGRGCHLVEGRMTAFTKEQWHQISKLLGCSARENEKVSPLVYSCLILTIASDSLVNSLDSILEGIYRDKSDLEKIGRAIIYPKTETEARQLKCHLCHSMPYNLYSIKGLR